MNRATLGSIGRRLVATFVAAAIPNTVVGSMLGVEIVTSAIMSGAIAVLGVIQLLAVGLRDDGKLTADEIDAAFGEE